MRAVKDLVPGDLVALDGDEFADPDRSNTLLEHEFQCVDELEAETPACTCVYFDNFTCGFPPEHEVRVKLA